MAQKLWGSLLRQLGTLPGARPGADFTDRQLLEWFAGGHGEAAFTALLQRHGAMVLGVCRRVLRNDHDAEDAFQATFLVLARKAAAVRWRDSVGPWLYEVAYRVARKAKSRAARRAAREGTPGPADDGGATFDAAGLELRAVLDQELARLPAKYRSPVVLCYLEGKTNAEAAGELGWTKGTVSGRLARARELLRARLVRRGWGVPLAAMAALFAPPAAPAAVPAVLAAATLRAASHPAAAVPASVRVLVQGVLLEVVAARLKLAAALILVACLTAGAGALAYRAASAPPGAPRAVTPNPERPPAALVWAEMPALPRGAGAAVVWSVAFAPDGRTLAACADGTVELWEPAAGRKRDTLRGHADRQVVKVAFAPDGRTLASVDDRGGLKLWDPATLRERARLTVPSSQAWQFAFAPDGRTLASAHGGPAVTLWDVHAGRLRAAFEGHWSPVNSLAFTPDGRAVVTADAQGVKVRDAETLRVLASYPVSFPQDSDETEHLAAVSPDGRTGASLRASGGVRTDHTVRLWDLAAGRLRATCGAPRGGVLSTAFAPDGRTLAASGDDGAVRLWDTATGRERAVFAGPEWGYGLMPLAFSPDGKALAAGGGGLRLWAAAERHP